jgi:hypothetical protein
VYHLDNSADVARLNAFKGDDVFFMFPLVLTARAALETAIYLTDG